MTAHPAVAMPGQIAEALAQLRMLPDDRDPFFVAAALRCSRGSSARSLSARIRGIGGERAQPGLGRGARHATQDRFAFRVLPPPGELVARHRLGAQQLGFREEARDLLGGEHAAHEEVAGGSQEMRHVLALVAGGEALRRVQRRAEAVAELRMLRVVDRAAGEHRPQRRLPGEPADGVAAAALRAPAVEQPRRGIQLVDDVLPDLGRELDHGVGPLVARHHVDVRFAAREVGVGRTVGQPEGEAAEPARVARRQRAVAGAQPPGSSSRWKRWKSSGSKASDMRPTQDTPAPVAWSISPETPSRWRRARAARRPRSCCPGRGTRRSPRRPLAPA